MQRQPRWWRTRVLCVVLAYSAFFAAGALAPSAHAGDAAAGSATATATPAAPPAPSDPRTLAKELYLTAEKLYAAAAYDRALLLYRLAYETRPDPIFLFNIAQCFRLAGKPALAASY